MEVDCDGPSSARRRRERRLRSWLRHERMTVAMALAEKLHHSAFRTHMPKKEEVEQDQALRGQTKASAREGEVHEKDVASRSQSTPHPGERPGLPSEPGPQRSDRTVRRSSGDNLPTLALPALAGSAGEVVDSSSLRFLTASALKARREEEEEERKKKEKEKMEERSAVHVEAAVALERARLLLEQASKRRKRKKRRKQRTPRTSSLPSLRRPRRRPRRWHAPGWFSSVFLLALCSSLSLAGPRCFPSRPFWTRRTVTRFFFTMACARLVLLVLFTSRCVFSLVCRPMMLGIKAGMDQTDILALVDTGICMVKVQLLDEVVVPAVCNDICPGPAACTVGDDFRFVSVFCVALGSTADTCGASVYKAFWKNFSHLSLKRWIAVLEVDSRLSVLPIFSAMLGSTVAGGESFSPDDAYDSAWNSVKPMKGKYTINYFQYQDVVGCVCMHNDASAASTIFAPTTTTTTSSS